MLFPFVLHDRNLQQRYKRALYNNLPDNRITTECEECLWPMPAFARVNKKGNFALLNLNLIHIMYIKTI